MNDGRKTTGDKISKYFFILSVLGLVYMIGFVTRHLERFPYSIINKAIISTKKIVKQEDGIREKFYEPTSLTKTVTIYDAKSVQDGLTLITTLTKEKRMAARLIDLAGNIVHEWTIDWFEIWPDCFHLTHEEKPKSRPGTHIHGAVVLKNGDLIFNFEDLGLVRLNPCGHVIWRLPYRTHHSIYMDEDDFLWIPGRIDHLTSPPEYPYLKNIVEPSILKVSLDGEILKEISIVDLLHQNGLPGLLVLSSLVNKSTNVSGDILHLNDVEVFPRSKPAGVFEAGDIMVSLRNINAVIVFSGQDYSIKYKSIGGFVRQHDPDFIDGNTISIFDNYNLGPFDAGYQSRILVESALTGEAQVYFTGDEQHYFYTKAMGKHQWLPNGNLLVTESRFGRVREITPQGEIVWQYNNIVEEGYVIFTEEATRLSSHFTADFFEKQRLACSKN